MSFVRPKSMCAGAGLCKRVRGVVSSRARAQAKGGVHAKDISSCLQAAGFPEDLSSSLCLAKQVKQDEELQRQQANLEKLTLDLPQQRTADAGG